MTARRRRRSTGRSPTFWKAPPSRVPGVKSISSTSRSGTSRVVVEFDEFDRPQRRRQRSPRRGRQRRAPAARRRRRHHHRQGRRQFRRHHAARGHRRAHVDPGSDAARRGPDRGPARGRRGRRRRHAVRRPRAARARADRPERARRARPHRRRPRRRRSRPSRSTRRPATSRPATSRCSCAPTRASKSAEEIEAIRINSTTSVGDVADVIFGPAEETSTHPHQRPDRHRPRHRPPGAVEHARHFRGRARRGRRARHVAAARASTSASPPTRRPSSAAR